MASAGLVLFPWSQQWLWQLACSLETPAHSAAQYYESLAAFGQMWLLNKGSSGAFLAFYGVAEWSES